MPSNGRSWRRRPRFSTSRSWRRPRTANSWCSTGGSSPARLTSSSITRPWFTQGFYTLVRDRLTPGGTMTVQAGMTKINELSFFTAIHRTLRDVFPVVAGYQTFVSCFGTPWGFIVGSKKVDPRRQDPQVIDKLVAERVGAPLDYWDGLTHQHAFGLPKFLRKAIDAETRVSTDSNPLIFS